MKRKMLLFIALLVGTVAVAQQEVPMPPSPEEHIKRFTERLDKEVALPADKKEKVVAAYKEFFTKMDQLHAKYPPPAPPPPPPAPPAGMKEEMDKLVAEKDSKIKSILSEEQYKKLKEMDNKRRPGKGHHHPPPPPPVPES